MSIRLRLALLLTGVFLGLMAVFALGVYLTLSYYLYNDVDSGLTRSGNVIAYRLVAQPRSPTPSLARAIMPGPGLYTSLQDARGTEIQSSPGALPTGPPDNVVSAALAGRGSFVNVKEQSVDYRLHVLGIDHVHPAYGLVATPLVLVVAQSLGSVESSLNLLKLVMLAAGALALVTAAGAAWAVATRGLGPVTELTRAAERVGQGLDLSQRLPEPATGDEVARLSAAFNASLDRLERTYGSLQESLDRQRQFVADASHELRTPLTVILTNAETLLDHPEMPARESRQSLTEVLTEAMRLAELSGSLLQLARGDSGAPVLVAPVDWDDFVGRAAHDAKLICAPRPVRLHPNGGLGSGQADVDSLQSALRIIFDNIARHTPESARVDVEATADAREVRLVISDSGPGVRPDLLPRIFDRFFRAAASRTGHGSGLGLAIAKSVVERQRGSISARNVGGGGLAVELSVPRHVRPA
jgi:signal transduction histidine kinase